MEDINTAIEEGNAHDLAQALKALGVNAYRTRRANSSVDLCDVAGYGSVFYDERGWVVEAYFNGVDYPTDDDEMRDEMKRIVEMKRRIA